ncbi:MAG TPA: Dabb family protein [Blastocatellia bacterium]|nr:Dabb family protein [Blastocatellia bacterium]
MIRHVVFFKFKPEASKAQRDSVVAQLRALPDQIDVIRKFEVGENILPQARAWDAVLIGEYDDLAALDVYSNHPAHVAVVARIREISDSVGSVDYEFGVD